jgi:hypothetical protein
MPFTFSHPALVLPFYAMGRKYLSLSGLVMGSIAPDFEYFFRMKKGVSQYSHTLAGVLYFNLPLSLLLLFLFHGFIRRPLVLHLPPWLFKRFYFYHSFQWSPYFKTKWIRVVVSVLAGATTHLGWDWLTHTNADYLYVRQHQFFFFSSWQHHSVIYILVHSMHSLAGLAVLAAALRKQPVGPEVERPTAWIPFWSKLIAGAFFITLIRFLLNVQVQIGDLAVSFIAAIFLALLFISLRQNAKDQP